MNPHYPAVSARALHRCEYCHAPEAVFNFPFEVEHIQPLSRKGTNLLENLALACRSCNLFKGNSLKHVDSNTNTLVALFNPRLNDWSEHFSVDINSGEIIGHTPIGRATIACLRMNNAPQLMARHQWIKLGLFP